MIHGELKNLTPDNNLKVLLERVEMLVKLNDYANSMGVHSRRSRGLFFVFERFHLNYAFSHEDFASEDYREIEQRLTDLNALVVLCAISPEKTRARLLHRAILLNESIGDDYVEEYLISQKTRIDAVERSSVPTLILNTDEMEWDRYARQILEKTV